MTALYSIGIFLFFYAIVFYWARKAAKDAERDTRNVYPMAGKEKR